MSDSWAFVTRRFTTRTGRGRTLFDLTRCLAQKGEKVTVYAGYVDQRLRQSRGIAFEDVRHTRSGLLSSFRSFERASKKAGLDADFRVAFDAALGPGIWRLSGGCQESWLSILSNDQTLQTLSGQKPSGIHLRLAKREARWIDKGERRLIAPSQLVAQQFMDQYKLGQEVTVIPPGVDTSRFRPSLRSEFMMEVRGQWGLEPEAQVVLFVGGAWARRGLDRALEAMADLHKSHPDLWFVIIGESRGREIFVRQSEELGVRSRTLFVGTMEWVEHAYAAADLVVLPTRYSPSACVPLEAVAAGVPVVTTTMDGSAALLEGLEGVRIIDGASKAQLVGAMDDLLDHTRFPERADQMRTRAQDFDAEAQATAWLALKDERERV